MAQIAEMDSTLQEKIAETEAWLVAHRGLSLDEAKARVKAGLADAVAKLEDLREWMISTLHRDDVSH